METEAARFLAQRSPVMVTGTAPCITEVAQASILSVIAGLILTGLLCKTVKTAFSEPTESQRGPEAATPTVGPKPAPDDAAAKLRRLAQLRDSGVITEADFLAKKKTCRPMSRADAAADRLG